MFKLLINHTTIGVDFGDKIIAINNYRVKYRIWQLASQERFRNPSYSIYYKKVNGIIFVLDITDESSFSDLDYWISGVKQATEHSNDNKVYFLCANKCDKCDLEEERRITKEQIKEFYKNNFNKKEEYIFETSAKTRKNINEMFDALAAAIFKKMNS